MGVSKRRLILLFVVVLVVVMVRFPTTDAAVTASNIYSVDATKRAITGTLTNVVVASGECIYFFSSAGTKNADSGKAITGVVFEASGGDEAFEKVGTGFFENGKATVEIWRLLNPSAETQNVVCTWVDNQATWEGAVIGAYVLAGVDTGGTADDGFEAASGTGTSLDMPITTASGDFTIAVFGNMNSDDMTEDGDGSEGWSIASDGTSGASSYFTATDAQSDHSFSGTSDDWAAAGVSINPSVGGGTDYTAYPDGDFTMGGDTALAASFSKTLIEGFALAGVTALAAAFVITLIQGFTLVGTTALAASFSKTLVEGFALAGSTSIFIIIQILIVEGFALTGGVSLAAAFVVTLAQGFALGGTTALAVAFVVTLAQGFSLGGSISLAVAYVKSLVEGFSLAGTVSAFKVFIVNLQESFSLVGIVEITKIAGTVVAASMIHLLFFSLEMWGYLGPMAVVIGGYFVMTKDKNLGVLWFVVECLIMAQYFALLEATPEYWWHIFILLIGGLSTAAYSLGKR